MAKTIFTAGCGLSYQPLLPWSPQKKQKQNRNDCAWQLRCVSVLFTFVMGWLCYGLFWIGLLLVLMPCWCVGDFCVRFLSFQNLFCNIFKLVTYHYCTQFRASSKLQIHICEDKACEQEQGFEHAVNTVSYRRLDWTFSTRVKRYVVWIICLMDRNVLLQWIRLGIRSISAALNVAVNLDLTLAFMNEMVVPIAGLWLSLNDVLCTTS